MLLEALKVVLAGLGIAVQGGEGRKRNPLHNGMFQGLRCGIPLVSPDHVPNQAVAGAHLVRFGQDFIDVAGQGIHALLLRHADTNRGDEARGWVRNSFGHMAYGAEDHVLERAHGEGRGQVLGVVDLAALLDGTLRGSPEVETRRQGGAPQDA